MGQKTRWVSKSALAVLMAAGLVLQGAVAFAAPASAPRQLTEITPTDVQAEANAEADAGSNADASAGATGSADSGSDSSATGSASSEAGSATEANAEAESGADASAGADATGGQDPEQPGGADSEAGQDPEAASDADSSGSESPEEGEASSEPSDEEPEIVEEESPLSVELNRDYYVAETNALISGFQPGNIISDANFYYASAMSTSQIQSFLNQRVPRCTLGDPGREMGKKWGTSTLAWACLKTAKWNLTASTIKRPANAYCRAYTGGSSESSASVIAKVAQACGISPKVLLVMLEKEQSLVQDSWPTARQFDFAMGAYCPDSGPGNSPNCDPTKVGFPNQVYYAAYLLKVYQANNGLNYHPYTTNTIQWHPNPGCGTSRVYISNMATASLYTYTPYRPNQAALNAGWGEGDGCSTYGNRNFYQFYKAWFGSPNGQTFFPDVPTSHKFYKEIEWMGTTGLSTGVQSGNGQRLYLPYARVTREAMAAFMYRLASASYKAPSTSPFADLRPGDKFYREITWMYTKGYTTGIRNPNGGKPLYAPKDNISREAMAAFLYRYDGANYNGPSNSPFVDMRKGDKFYNEITWMKAAGLSTGIANPGGGKSLYVPKDRVSREAMAAFIYRLSH